MKKLIILLILSSAISNAEENIFDKMDEKIAVSTGIIKLTKSERMALSQWLKNTDKKPEKLSRKELKEEIKSELIAENQANKKREEEIIRQDKIKNMGFHKEQSTRENIHSFIVGEFKGWQGKNVFKLKNGQIWKQAERRSFYIPKRNDPKITIKPKLMGSWILYVDGFSRGVKVKRIK